MKAILALLLTLLLGSAMMAGENLRVASDDDAMLTAEERAKAIQMLKDSEKEFYELVGKLSDEQWNYKPSVLRWSVGETAQHIALAEGLLFGAVERALAAPANAEWKTKTAGKDAFIDNVLPNRSRKAQAPEPIQPLKVGKMTRAEIMAKFKASRAKSYQFIEATKLPLKAHTFDHPFPVFGTLNAYQWFMYIPLHHLRHNLQIAEVKATAGFPK